ncbi:SpoIIIAH-like family protein [Clostridium baratii]|uniref:SpoIIIAH-like family protein n=1 Tax=Clostridium baratii TaxID=1561 RepID=UPI0006BAAC41|nr:SpoIIIAH-like family protein [Clostridium baratii]MBS6043592.1 SpoIIIAH-like family protein [Clostridium baratii]MDU1053410.1 SpoIIIAH-like family protein [Clostridium baratii]
MNKKQFGIIFTLLGLIICVGLLATKLNNGGLNDPDGLSQAVARNDEEKAKENEEETSTQNDFFYDSKSDKEKKDQETIANLKSIAADANTSKEQKASAQKELVQKTKQKDNENRIETSIKNKGIEDAICTIEGTKAKIYVRTEGIDQKTSIQIQEIVQDIANINDVSIEVKK